MTDLVKAWQAKLREMGGVFRKLFLASGRLIQEAADGEYHKELGHDSLQEYIQEEYATGRCPIQWREAYDRLRVVRMIDSLGLKDADLESVASVKLKIISGLDADKYRDQMLKMLEAVKKAPVKWHMDKVKEECDKIAGKAPKAEAPAASEPASESSTKVETEAAKSTPDATVFTFTIPNGEVATVRDALAVFGANPEQALVSMCKAILAASAAKPAAASAAA